MAWLDGAQASDVARAAALLQAGELVAFPTETVYGLGARADDDAAVRRIFEAKGRPSNHPLIVHLADASGAAAFADAPGAAAETLMAHFWPGPLTLIVPRRAGRGEAAAGGQDSIGLRVPAHPVAQALLRAAAAVGVAGVAGPSANRFGRVSPTTAAHVAQEFGPELAVLDGGACRVGIESTIVDCTRNRPRLLRPGLLARDAIEAVLGAPLGLPGDDAPRASGTLAAHYAPNARVQLYEPAALNAALSAPTLPEGLAVYSRSAVPQRDGTTYRTMPPHAAPAAHELFAALREFDAQGARCIWVELPPPTPDWEGVRDRLQRAAAAS